MSKGLIFFCCACCILLLTIVNLSIGPFISGYFNDWGTLNCALDKDNYDKAKDDGKEGDELKYGAKWEFENCRRCKGMYDMEYTSFIFDVAIGFVCGLMGLLHLFEVKKELVSKTGLIGLCCGIVGFILTFVYVILNGLVYTTSDTDIYKMDSNGAFAELKDNNKYECFYFDKEYNTHALEAKYSDLGKKQYNYDKDLLKKYYEPEVYQCRREPSICAKEYIEITQTYSDDSGIHNCKYLYYKTEYPSPYDELYEWRTEFWNKDKSDRFLTTLILSLLVCLANIGLALFGFLLYRTPDDFSK